MNKHTNIFIAQTVASRLRVDMDTPMMGHARTRNIIAHYQRELDTHHIGYTDCVDRCIHDLAGCNYHPERTQRSVNL